MSKSKMIVGVSVDVTKLDKSKFIEGKKGGKYVNLTIFVNNEKDQYGNDCSVAQSQTKEEREAKAKLNFVGNGKINWEDKTAQEQPAERFEVSPEQVKVSKNSQELPF